MIDYPGYLEGQLSLPIEIKCLKTTVLSVIFPTTEWHKRVLIYIGTSITQLMINSLYASYSKHASQSQDGVCFTTLTRRPVLSQELQGRIVQTIKLVTLQLFPPLYLCMVSLR